MNYYSTAMTLLFLMFLPAPVLASDTAKEQRWAEQIEDSLVEGEAVWLDVAEQKVFAIYTEQALGVPKGGVILMHGIGAHPDWPDVISPLRRRLPDYGWSTLSIQMPILANDATIKDYVPLFDEVAPRIEAAVSFLQGKDLGPITLVAHSLGAIMAADYLSRQPQSSFKGFVAIGLSSSAKTDERLNSIKAISQIHIPILDIYGSDDLAGVLNTAKQRQRAAIKAAVNAPQKSQLTAHALHNRKSDMFNTPPVVTSDYLDTQGDRVTYRQIEVVGANHFFTGQSDELVKRIRGWLTRHTLKQHN